MELTKEVFEKGIGNLMEKMVTKDDLKLQLAAQTKELKQYTNDSFETQQEWMEERFKELIIKYDVRERVEKLEKQVAQLSMNRPARA